MVKTIYFIRHATRDHTVKSDAAPLSKKGQQEAKGLVAWFDGENVDAIYSSPYARTIETVKPLAHTFQLPIQMVEGLRERLIGRWVDDFDTYAIQQWNNFDFYLPGGESLKQVQQRMVSSLDDILSHDRVESIVISGHGTSLAVLFHKLTSGRFGYVQFQHMTMPDIYRYDVKTQTLNRIVKP
ncbi:histidine phosphatase family protein [Staphylococcus delphini]|uniref:Histidine phosphatase family protein n=1 Tax=Staphylococcus delphini TaxID=53344 RepID=A0AAQ0D948_9STAP|nr:histidine phosphatase family protein [Staphylococcus delphini]QUM67899.1 histidine phosphatase family protein [Staphylococcus delphini]QUM70345.1 histidine phosphatase family protein [Staphylococcus delphini]